MDKFKLMHGDKDIAEITPDENAEITHSKESEKWDLNTQQIRNRVMGESKRLVIDGPMATHKEERLHLRISQTLKADIYKQAQSKGMSISEYVRYLLRREVENDS